MSKWTPQIINQMRSPFPAADVEWRVGGKVDGKSSVLAYITARAIAERLDELFPGDWEIGYGDLNRGVVGVNTKNEEVSDTYLVCSLTVGGLRRANVGTASNMEHAKGAYSDAFKRAATMFGIGAYLYDFPQVILGASGYSVPVAARPELLLLTQHINAGTKELPSFRNITVNNYTPMAFKPPICESCMKPVILEKGDPYAFVRGTEMRTGKKVCRECYESTRS